MIACRIEAADAKGARIAVDGVRLTVPLDARRTTPGGAATLGVRPEHLREADGETALRATVMAVERLGGESLVHAGLASGETIAWRTPGNSKAEAGDAIRLMLDAGHCHLFDEQGHALAPAVS
jgi:multiple sugar transport system ATP-binding protein